MLKQKEKIKTNLLLFLKRRLFNLGLNKLGYWQFLIKIKQFGIEYRQFCFLEILKKDWIIKFSANCSSKMRSPSMIIFEFELP
jgi:hypothetical protein